MSGTPSSQGLDLRTAVILLAAVFVGETAGLLTFIANHQWSLAVLTGGGGAAGAAFFFDWLIARQ